MVEDGKLQRQSTLYAGRKKDRSVLEQTLIIHTLTLTFWLTVAVRAFAQCQISGTVGT